MVEVFPDPAYRPIPIVWVAAAIIGQAVGLSLLYLGPVAIWRAEPHFIMAAGALWTGYLLFRLWPRKLAVSALGWRIAFLTILTLQFAMFALACLNPKPCKDIYQYPSAACLAEDNEESTSDKPSPASSTRA